MFTSSKFQLLAALVLTTGASSPAQAQYLPGCGTPSMPQSSYCFRNQQPPAPPAADRLRDELARVGVETFTSPAYKRGIVKHIVLFRYKSTVSDEQKAEVRQRFLALKDKAIRNGRPYITSLVAGGEISGEGADQGLEDGYIVTFRSQGDRNFYVGQPIVADPASFDSAHQAFKDFVGPLLDDGGVVVFDFQV